MLSAGVLKRVILHSLAINNSPDSCTKIHMQIMSNERTNEVLIAEKWIPLQWANQNTTKKNQVTVITVTVSQVTLYMQHT